MGDDLPAVVGRACRSDTTGGGGGGRVTQPRMGGEKLALAAGSASSPLGVSLTVCLCIRISRPVRKYLIHMHIHIHPEGGRCPAHDGEKSEG